jgi:formylmethanofuran dehydrogenase subunit E
LAELGERYAINATLEPLVLVGTEIPVLVVDLSVHRRRTVKRHTIYSNPLLKQLVEPIGCSRCGSGVLISVFTDDDDAPLCAKCAG